MDISERRLTILVSSLLSLTHALMRQNAAPTKTNQNRIRSDSDRRLLVVCFCWHTAPTPSFLSLPLPPLAPESEIAQTAPRLTPQVNDRTYGALKGICMYVNVAVLITSRRTPDRDREIKTKLRTRVIAERARALKLPITF